LSTQLTVIKDTSKEICNESNIDKRTVLGACFHMCRRTLDWKSSILGMILSEFREDQEQNYVLENTRPTLSFNRDS
jgi:hypothetical protein